MSKLSLADRVQETGVLAGGTVTLSGAVADFKSFAATVAADAVVFVGMKGGSTTMLATAKYDGAGHLVEIVPEPLYTMLPDGPVTVYVTVSGSDLVIADDAGEVAVRSLSVYAAVAVGTPGPGGSTIITETPAPFVISGDVTAGYLNIGPNLRVGDPYIETNLTIFTPGLYLRPYGDFSGNHTAFIDGQDGFALQVPATAQNGVLIMTDDGPISLVAGGARGVMGLGADISLSLQAPLIYMQGAVTVAGSLTATSLIGPLTGNADTASRLSTARNITLGLDASGMATFDGSSNANINVTLAASGVTAGTYSNLVVDAKGRVTSASPITSGHVIAALGFTPAAGNPTLTVTGDATGSGATSLTLTLSPSGVTAGTYSNLVVDAKGRITSASAITSGHVTSALGFTPIPASASISGNSATATKLVTARTLALTGHVSGSASFDGSTNVSISTTVAAPTVITASAFGSYTCDLSAADAYRLTLIGPSTTISFVNGADSGRYTVELIQDSVGGRSVTLSGVSYGTDITAYVPTTAANKADMVGIWRSGSAYRVVAISKGFS